MTLFEIDSVPNKGVDKYRFMEAIGRRFFAIIHDAGGERTYLYLEDRNGTAGSLIESMLPGLTLKVTDTKIDFGNADVASVYKACKEGSVSVADAALQSARHGILAVAFLPCDEGSAEEAKVMVENTLSNKKVKATRSFFEGSLGSRVNSSMHMDLYNESEEKKMLLMLLEDIDDTLLSGMPLFKVFVVVSDETGSIQDRLADSSIVLHSSKEGIGSAGELEPRLNKERSIVFGSRHASSFISFNWVNRVSYPIGTFIGCYQNSGAIALGTYSKDGVCATDRNVAIDPSAMNLGIVVAGLPGSGKTREAMAIINQVERKKTGVAIVSPTDEWDGFATRDMHLIRLGVDKVPINFFANPGEAGVEKFYEDLALLISTASNSGPYQSPMEKCLLNAFKCAYGRCKVPNPTLVYDEIESSIIKFHGRTTNTGVRYTKHGENIKAALENLRHILSNPQYSATKGVQIRELVSDGVVFSLAGVSNATKPYLYALLLNQFYAIADSFDTDGDNELRMLMCIEEAQTIFGKELENAATNDLVRRMQDFRKRGIGMMLVVHGVSDLNADIRRMCQNKLYFKQAPDIAQIAAKDLVFTYAEQDDVVLKLKHLDSRICAADFIRKDKGSKLSGDSVFIKTLDYDPVQSGADFIQEKQNMSVAEHRIGMKIELADMRRQQTRKPERLSLYFLNEKVGDRQITGDACNVEDILKGRQYTIKLASESGRAIGSCAVTADKTVRLLLSDSGLAELRPAAP